MGSKAYKAQESAYARSGARKTELLESIQQLRSSAESMDNPRTLRTIRRDLDGVRGQFDAGDPLSPQDRQALWEAWRDASQFVWERLTATWEENERHLRGFLEEARQQLDRGNVAAARSGVSRFFENLRTHEGRQATIGQLKSEAEAIRQQATVQEEHRMAQRVERHQAQQVSSIGDWKAELDRNRQAAARLAEEVAALDRDFQQTRSILDQAMIRGNLVDKRRKLSELERTNRNLEQRIEQAEEVPLISAG
jgi:F0F1-type ATP synthase membrane subunit b/b'